MQKFRASLPSFTRSSNSPSTKLTKAFRFNKDHTVLPVPKSANPFMDGPDVEEASLPKSHFYLHIVALFFTFLAICTMGAVAAFQAKWFSVSGGTGFTLFLLIVSFLLSTGLLLIPMIYDRWDRLVSPAKFLAQSRSTLILHAFGSGVMLLSAFIVTISVFTAKGCKDVNNDPHAELGDEYKDGLKQWCTTKKASAVFDWLSFAAWCILLILTVLVFRREKRREPSFIPPPAGNESYYPQYTKQDETPMAPGPDPYDSGTGSAGLGYEYTRAGVGNEARPSMDAYGAFQDEGRMPLPLEKEEREETSRTMQLAFNDPYAQIRASLAGNPAPMGYARPPTHQVNYSQGGLPEPPMYGGGYR